MTHISFCISYLLAVYSSRGLSPESSSDSGNETNSSEMTEISELAASHRLNESHMRLLMATREGYQPLLEEKTEFPVSPGAAGTTQKKPRSPQRYLQPPAIPPRRSPLLDTASSSGSDGLVARPQTQLSSTLQRPSSTTPGGEHHKKSADSSGKYNTFSTREGHRGESGGGSRGRLEMDQRTSFCERGEGQRRQNSFLSENAAAEAVGTDGLPGDRPRIPRPPSVDSERLLDVVDSGRCGVDDGAAAVERDEHLVAAASPVSPNKKPRSGGSDQASDVQNDHRPVSRQQSAARLCEYHLAKRVSNVHGEAHSSQRRSLCSSLDAGGGADSSACAPPTDSPLGPGAAELKRHRLQRRPLANSSSSLLGALNYEDGEPGIPRGAPGQSSRGKDLRPHADPALLRKMLPNIHPPAAEPGRPSSATSSQHKETTGTGSKRPHNDLHAKQQACFKGRSQTEGSEAFRQLITYLTVSQMHQGRKLHSAGMGGAVKKDTRRFITSNPQLVEMVKNRGSAIARCPCTPSPTSSPFLSPNVVSPHANTAQPASRNPQAYQSATLPAKGSSDAHAQTRDDSLDVAGERRSSFSGPESELERSGVDPEHFPCETEGFITSGNREAGGDSDRPPPRSRSQPSGGTEDRFRSDPRAKRAARQSPRSGPNDSLCFSAAPSVSGQRADLNAGSLGRGDHPSAFVRQTCAGARAGVTSPAPNSQYPPPPPPPPCPPSQADARSGNSGCAQDAIRPVQSRPNHNHVRPRTLPDPFCNGLQRGRELKRSSSGVIAGSGSADALFDKPARCRSQQPLSSPPQGDTKVQRRPTSKRLSKSYSQGAVSSHACWSAGCRASVAFPLQKDGKHVRGSQKLDGGPWRCDGPFSDCFFKRKPEEDEIEWERPRRSRDVDDGWSAADVSGEVLANVSFSDRLSRIDALKDRVHRFPSGFVDVRRDAGELIALVRSGVGRCDRGAQTPLQDVSRFKRLLSVESKELGRACRRMALAHGSPEEMLLAVTCSFQVLCRLCEACVCLVRGLGASAAHQQREVAAKVDEVVMNYICLLKAAEAAAVGAPGEHSVKALVRHTSTMSAIANALTRSLKTLLSK